MKRTWNHDEIEAALRALVDTLAPDGNFAPEVARMVDVLKRHVGSHYELCCLAPIAMSTLTRRLTDPWLRQQLVRAAVVGMFLDPNRDRAGLRRVEALAAALEVDEPAVGDLALFIAGKRWRLRRRVLRRMWVVDHIKARIAQRGFLRTMIPMILSTLFGRYRNREVAAKFAALRSLPPNTLGRAYIDFLTANHFALPGELGAVSDIIVQHDLAHVLGEYGTTPAEETLVASFSAGHRVKDPFAFVVFVLLQFHLGLRMTPGAPAEIGYFDPARVLAAIDRGAAMSIDLTARWNYWPDLVKPIDEVRRRYGIAPRVMLLRRVA